MVSKLTLTRTVESDHGTFGSLDCPDVSFATAELPWRENRRRVSRIPAGTYRCRWHFSQKFGECFEVTGVPGRTRILIHAGNFGGDSEQGMTTDTWGCLLLGTNFSNLETRWGSQKAVINSNRSIDRFHATMDKQDFDLEIIDGFDS